MDRATVTLVGLGALVLLFGLGAGADPAPATTAAERVLPDTPAAASAVGGPDTYELRAGEVLEYALRAAQTVQQRGGRSATVWNGTMQVRCLDADTDGFHVEVAFPQLRREPAGPVPSGSLVLRLSREGVVRAWASTAAARDQYGMLVFGVRALQFPAVPAGEVELRDETGCWRHRVDGGEPGPRRRLLRQKLEIGATEEALGNVVLVESSGEAVLADGALERSQTREVCRLEGVAEVTSTLELSFELTRRFRVSDGAVRLPSEFRTEWPAVEVIEDDALTRPMAVLLADLVAMSQNKDGLTSRASYELFLALARLLAQDPAAGAALVDRLRTDLRPPAAPIELTSLLIGALAQAAALGGTWCADGMAMLVGDADVEFAGVAVRACHALHGCSWAAATNVVDAVVGRLAGLSATDPLVGDGVLAIGSMLDDAPVAAAKALIETLRQRVDPCTWLSMLQNVGNEQVTLEPGLWHLQNGTADEKVRAAGILGECRDPRASAALLQALATESDETVLRGVAEALGERHGDVAFEALRGLAGRTTASTAVRREAVASMARWPESSRRTEALEWSRDHDPDGDVRAAAGRLLGR